MRKTRERSGPWPLAITGTLPPMSGILLPQISAHEVVASGLFLRRRTEPRWLLIRATKHGEWGFPKGHSDPGEDLIATALRETAEETGIALVEILGPPVVNRYVLPSGKKKVTAYFPAVTETDVVELSDEHDAFRWANHNEIRTLLSHSSLVALFSRVVVSWPASPAAAL